MDSKAQRKSRGSIENLDFRFGSSSSQTSQTSGDFCRICHESDNNLLTPCLCSGTLRFVHQACLTSWLTASETNACELCKFPFIMQSKIKPFNEWRSLDMSGVERRRLFCAVLFHLAAALCVIWSLCVLIERSAEEIRQGRIGWPFWTKLVVVTVGLTGGIVFMYIQCKQYLNLCARWRARNRILLIQNAPEKNPVNQATSPLTFQNSQQSSNQTLRRNNSSILVITAPLNIANMEQNSDQPPMEYQLRQQSQIVANIESSSINFELDDDGFSQISFKPNLRHEEGNSSRGSLHNVYDNTSISTTNTSGTTRYHISGDNESCSLKATSGLSKVQEIEDNEKHRKSEHDERIRTSMFIENSDILNDQNYPKLYYRHSTILLPTTAKTSRAVPKTLENSTRRYSDTKLLNSLQFENELLVNKKFSQDDILGSPTKNDTREVEDDLTLDQLQSHIQNILDLDVTTEHTSKSKDHVLVNVNDTTRDKDNFNGKRKLFQSLPNLEIS